jgi:hypothetical protein
MHVYEVRPHKDHRGVDLISDALPFNRLWYDGPSAVGNAIGFTTLRPLRTGEWPFLVPETRSAFHPHAQRNAFRSLAFFTHTAKGHKPIQHCA